MPDLFDEQPAKRKLRPKRETDPAIARCIDFFYDRYVARWNPPALYEGWKAGTVPASQLVTPLIAGGKHGAQFKRLLAWGEDVVRELVRLYFTTTDPKVARDDYSLDRFFVHAQYLRLKLARNHRVVDARTAENLDAAARATGRR